MKTSTTNYKGLSYLLSLAKLHNNVLASPVFAALKHTTPEERTEL